MRELLLSALFILTLTTYTYAQFEPAGQALVVDLQSGPEGDGALFGVDPITGSRVLISDFGNPAQGPLGSEPAGVVVDGPVSALVIDIGAGTDNNGALFSVNCNPKRSTYGDRTLISDFGKPAQGPLGQTPRALALDGSGNVFVIDVSAGTDSLGLLFLVDLTPGPSLGDRTIISDFGNPAQGPLGGGPDGVILDSLGRVLVIDNSVGTNGDGALFIVDTTPGPTFGDRVILSDFGNPAQGPLGNDPSGIGLDGSGNALVVDQRAGTNDSGTLFLVDLATGQRTVISDFGSPAQGPTGRAPQDVVLDSTGNALVTDDSAGTDDRGSLFLVDLTPGPTFGDRTLISDFGNPAEGPLGQRPFGVAFKAPLSLVRPVPTLSEWGLIAMAGVLGVVGLIAVRKRLVA